MATTKNTQAFESFDIEQLSYDELLDYANNRHKLYASLDGGERHRTPEESYIVGATFRVLRSRTPHGQWEASLKEMRLIPRSIQRLMYIADGVDDFNLHDELVFSTSTDKEIIAYIRSLRG